MFDISVPFFCLFLTDMKLLVTLCLLAVCAVLVSSRFAGRRPFRQGYERYSLQDVLRDDEGWDRPIADRKIQVPNCKGRGGECKSGDDCCYCTTEGGCYSCMICSSYDHKCF